MQYKTVVGQGRISGGTAVLMVKLSADVTISIEDLSIHGWEIESVTPIPNSFKSDATDALAVNFKALVILRESAASAHHRMIAEAFAMNVKVD